MISLKPLIALLESKPMGFDGFWFRQVGGASEFAQITVDDLPLPACWIVRAADHVQHAGERAEDVRLTFDVVIAIENTRTERAAETDDELIEYRKAVKDLLLGWEIECDVKPIKFAGGQVLEYTNADIYWRDRYEFSALITNYLPDPPQYGGLKQTGESL